MPVVSFLILLKTAIRIDAREKLKLIGIATISNMKEHDRKRLIKEYESQAETDEPITKERIEHDRKLLLKKLGRSML